MSFPVVFGNTKYFVDFKHDLHTGTKCSIWLEEEEGREGLVVYSQSILKYPDNFCKITGRKMALKSALNRWYVKSGMSRDAFRELRAAVYESMWAKMKMHTEDKRFLNGNNSGTKNKS